jgi:hypothetical protein
MPIKQSIQFGLVGVMLPYEAPSSAQKRVQSREEAPSNG